MGSSRLKLDVDGESSLVSLGVLVNCEARPSPSQRQRTPSRSTPRFALVFATALPSRLGTNKRRQAPERTHLQAWHVAESSVRRTGEVTYVQPQIQLSKRRCARSDDDHAGTMSCCAPSASQHTYGRPATSHRQSPASHPRFLPGCPSLDLRLLSAGVPRAVRSSRPSRDPRQ